MNLESELLGTDLFGETMTGPKRGPLAERFLMPPFSVLSARDGAWQDRKRAWLSIGLKGEQGRDNYLAFNGADDDFHSSAQIDGRRAGLTWGTSNEITEKGLNFYRNKEAARTERPVTGANSTSGKNSAMLEGEGCSTSIFDPVVCELMYRWFCPAGGTILDPFAGGSVRGIVATYMGRKYWGCDLRPEQIEANEAQANQLCNSSRPTWVCGDSREQLDNAPDEVDFVFSCPPYGDLEVYSDLPDDISNMKWPNFCEALSDIIQKSVARLKPNRFACFVVGDFRDPVTHSYRGFPFVTTVFFLKAGLKLHNEAILVTSVGSLPVRVAKGFEVTRKMGKTHQNILVFVKGDPRKAAAACEVVPAY